jgi:hypothetical protein
LWRCGEGMLEEKAKPPLPCASRNLAEQAQFSWWSATSGAGERPALVGQGEYRIWWSRGAWPCHPPWQCFAANLTRKPGIWMPSLLSHLIHPRNAVNLFVSCSTMLHCEGEAQPCWALTERELVINILTFSPRHLHNFSKSPLYTGNRDSSQMCESQFSPHLPKSPKGAPARRAGALSGEILAEYVSKLSGHAFRVSLGRLHAKVSRM